MQVNKYVHPSLIIPVHLKATKVTELLDDPSLVINALAKGHIAKFDAFFT